MSRAAQSKKETVEWVSLLVEDLVRDYNMEDGEPKTQAEVTSFLDKLRCELGASISELEEL